AAKYQVGFSTQPFFRTVTQWHEVADTHWRVPATIWGALPEGELFRTVRVVETSGETRKPALMRRISRVAGDALTPVIATGANAQSSGGMLMWRGLRTETPAGQSVPRTAGQTMPQTASSKISPRTATTRRYSITG